MIPVCMQGWHWTTASAGVVADCLALSALAHLRVRLVLGELTDDLLGLVLQMGSRVHSVHVGSM